jgi:hypothetical protein
VGAGKTASSLHSERFTNPDRFSKTQTGFQKTSHVEHEMLKTQTGSQKTSQALKKPDTLPRHIITNPDTVLLIQTRAPKTLSAKLSAVGISQ